MSNEIDNVNKVPPWVAPTLRRAAEMLMAQGREAERKTGDPYAGLMFADDAEFLQKLASAFEAGAIIPAQRLREAEARAEQLEAALQFYISRCRQPHETVNAHYERLAEEFHNKTGLTAPGKSLPVEMEALRDREKEIEAWHEFHDEPLENAREALEQQDATEATEKPVWVRYDVAPQIAEDALRRKLIKLGWTPPQCPYCKHGKQHCCAHIGEFICTRPLGHKGPHVACGEETHEIARGDDHE